MALSEDRVFCRDSMPFYRQLLAQDTDAVQIVVAARPHETGLRDYLTSERVIPDAFIWHTRSPACGVVLLVI